MRKQARKQRGFSRKARLGALTLACALALGGVGVRSRRVDGPDRRR